MSVITINLTTYPPQISSTYAGEIGENRAVSLKVYPDTTVTDVAMYVMYFAVEGGLIASSVYDVAESITIPLGTELTQQEILECQFVGLSSDGESVIDKSPVIRLTIGESLTGDIVPDPETGETIFTEIAELKAIADTLDMTQYYKKTEADEKFYSKTDADETFANKAATAQALSEKCDVGAYDSLKVTVDRNTGLINANYGKEITDIETVNNTINSKYTELKGSIATVDGKVDKVDAKVDDVDSKVTANTTAISKATTVESQHYASVVNSINGLNYDISTKQDILTSANAGDNITITKVDGVPKISSTGSSTIPWTKVTGKPTEFTPSAHTHLVADITDLDLSSYAEKDDVPIELYAGPNTSTLSSTEINAKKLTATFLWDGMPASVFKAQTTSSKAILYNIYVGTDGNTHSRRLTIAGNTVAFAMDVPYATQEYVDESIPSVVSDLENDAGYIDSSALDGYATESYVTSQGYQTEEEVNALIDAHHDDTKMDAPEEEGTTGQVLTKTDDGAEWQDASGGGINYTSAAQDTGLTFTDAYGTHKVYQKSYFGQNVPTSETLLDSSMNSGTRLVSVDGSSYVKYGTTGERISVNTLIDSFGFYVYSKSTGLYWKSTGTDGSYCYPVVTVRYYKI